MDTRRSPRLRGLAVMVSLAALMVPAGAAEAAKKKSKAKQPVVSSVRPMDAEVGDTLSIHGKNFLPGKGKNTVVFRRDGSKAIFVKSDVSTRKLIKVVVPGSLLEYMTNQGAAKLPTQFRVRILAKRFGKSFTTKRISPTIGPDTPPPPPPPPSEAKADGDCDGNGVTNGVQADDDSDGLNDDVELSLGLDPCKVDTDGDGLEDTWEFDCDRDRVLNRDESDDDNDLLSDDLEAKLMTDPCSQDSDGDGVEDGYEYRSAVDLNQDSYGNPKVSIPYPGKAPFPNPLNKDETFDYDGDGLRLVHEFKLWRAYGARDLSSLNYSDGLQFSREYTAVQLDDACALSGSYGPQTPADQVGCADPQLNDAHSQFVFLQRAALWNYSENVLLNMNGDEYAGDSDNPFRGGPDADWASDNHISDVERYYFDLAYRPSMKNNRVSDDERDADADGLPNWMEAEGYMTQDWWWSGPYGAKEQKFDRRPVADTKIDDPDSDGDGIVDGADDQDDDDVPNVRELMRQLVAGETKFEVTEKRIAGNVGTLRLNTHLGRPHPYKIGQVVEVSGVDGVFDGTHTITDVAGQDISFALTAADTGWQAGTGSAFAEWKVGYLPAQPAWARPLELIDADALAPTPQRAWVNPFNPCIPNENSATCTRYVKLDSPYAPFDPQYVPFKVLN